MQALLLATALTFGSVKEPVNLEIHRDVSLEPAPAGKLVGYRKTSFGGIDVYTKRKKSKDEDMPYPESELDVVLATGGKRFHLRLEGSSKDPKVTLLAPGVVGIEQESRADPSTDVTTTAVIDLRGKPREVDLTVFEGGRGRCNAFDSVYSIHSALSCSWNATKDDFVCTEANVLDTGRSTRVAWRRSTLFGGKTIASSTDLSDPKELLEHKRPVIAGQGVAERVSLAPNRDLFLIPPTGHRFIFRGWVVDYEAGKVIAVETHRFEDDGDGKGYELSNENVLGDGFTPDHEPITARVLPPIDGNVTPIVITDGKARGLFWLGYDGIRASLLRVATNAEEYSRCDIFRHATSASSLSGFAMHIESGWLESQEDDATEAQACSFDAHVRWNHGFVIKLEPEVCRTSAPVTIDISDDGKLTTTLSSASVP